MKYKYFIALALAMTATSATASSAVEKWRAGLQEAASPASYACSGRFSDDIDNNIDNMVPNVCAQLDTSTTLDNNPHAYTNPQATCDLNLDLPGLPSFDGFGFSMDTPDACGIVNKIIGDSVTGAVSKYEDFSNQLTGDLSKQVNISTDDIMGSLMSD